jgi:hypothetical protein
VTAGSTCDWTASSNAAWITVTSGASGSGNGTVSYSLTANTGAGGRRNGLGRGDRGIGVRLDRSQ